MKHYMQCKNLTQMSKCIKLFDRFGRLKHREKVFNGDQHMVRDSDQKEQ